VAESVGIKFVEALAAQDEAALATCFAHDVELRALVPPGFRERTGAADAAALIAGWLVDSTGLRLLESRTDEIADRLHIAYRFEGVEDGQPYVVEQSLYCSLGADAIERADLLCSGFRPTVEADQF
jgi:hypothetical protein